MHIIIGSVRLPVINMGRGKLHCIANVIHLSFLGSDGVINIKAVVLTDSNARRTSEECSCAAGRGAVSDSSGVGMLR